VFHTVLFVKKNDFNLKSRCVEWTGGRTGRFTKTLKKGQKCLCKLGSSLVVDFQDGLICDTLNGYFCGIVIFVSDCINIDIEGWK
jgi:hypothetical protein